MLYVRAATLPPSTMTRTRQFLCLHLIIIAIHPSQSFDFSKMTRPILYSAWFCPYAQRVWSCLNFFDISFDLVESLGSGMDAAYTKHPDLLKWNPKGLVPTLVTKDGMQCESIDILTSLYSERYQEREFQKLREEALKWNRLVCSPFYRVLMKQNRQDQERAWQDMVDGMVAFSDKLVDNDDNTISFYNYNEKRDDEPSLVDFTVFPFIHRLYIIQHYRAFCLADTHPLANDKIERWQARMEGLPGVASTIAERQSLINVYLRYADGSAQSKVGDAVRSGKEAHDIQ